MAAQENPGNYIESVHNTHSQIRQIAKSVEGASYVPQVPRVPQVLRGVGVEPVGVAPASGEPNAQILQAVTVSSGDPHTGKGWFDVFKNRAIEKTA